MTKTTATISTLLALLTGLVLGQLGPLAAPRPHLAASDSIVSEQDLDAARSFYDELNRFLATGDRDVESLLALDFVDHTDSLGSVRDAGQLIADWSETRVLLPQLQLEVVEMQETGRLVAVRLRVDPGNASPIPNIPLTAPTASSIVEFLHIEHSKVAERWSSDDRLPRMAMTLHADFDRTGPSLSGPVIQRFSLAASQQIGLSGDDMVVLRVISGDLQLNRKAVDPEGVVYPPSDPVATGQHRLVDATDTLLIRNLTSAATEFLTFSLYGLSPADSPPSDTETAAATPQIQGTALAYMPLDLTGKPSKRLRLSVIQITLPAGSWVAPHTPGMVEEIVVLDGALEASVQTGRALVTAGDGKAQPFDGTETASAGYGFSASSIATISYRVASAQPATLLIMTIEPAPSPGA